MQSVTSLDGTSIAWRTEGRGPPLLLVHGTTADHTRWRAISQPLSLQFTVHAMERRGRGDSTDAEDYDLQREAEDVAAVIDALGDSVKILSHSYGAVCTLEASLLTAGIDRMVLYEPPIPTGVPMYTPGVPDRMDALIDAGHYESALEVFFREVVKMPDAEFVRYRQLPAWERRVELAPTIPRELAIDRRYAFEPEKFAELTTPTLLLLGGDSPTMFRTAAEVVHHALPNSTITVLPNQQHIAMDTEPDMFLTEVIGFLTS